MGLRSSATRIAGIALAMTLLLVASHVAGAGAKPLPGNAERIGTVCAKKANRAATAAKRRQLRQHCIREMKRTAARRSTDVTPPTVAWKAPGAGATVKGKLGGFTCE